MKRRLKRVILWSVAAVGLSVWALPTDGVAPWVKVGDQLYLFSDCANVYAMVSGDRACLIGFASGRALDHLKELGVRQVDLVLVTHHHRDGLQGILEAVRKGIPIVIPDREAALIESAEEHWAGKRIFNNYEGASKFNAVTFNVPVSRRVKENDSINWGLHQIRVVETAGHTQGSLTYLVRFAGKDLAFTGDFYTAPGKTSTYHDLHWGYMPGPFTEAVGSAEKLGNGTPTLVCPDHGKPFLETGAGLAALRTNLENLQAIVRPNNKRPAEREPSQNYGPHLVFVGEPVTYAIVSDSRHAILVDPGYLNEQDLQTFQKKFDIVNIDAITYTHYHDDHVARSIENLYGWVGKNVGPLKTSIWVFEAMADVLAHPQRYNIPCLFPVPIEPDRIIRAGEVVKWEGLELNFVHFPGQTWYHTAIIVTANGRTYALTGDSVWGPADRTRPINGPVIPRNRYFLGHGHEVVFQTLIDRNVDTILPSHYAPFEVTRSDLERSLAWAYSIAPAVATLTDQPHPGYAMDPHWAHFYPYRVAVRQGSGKASADVSLLIRNYFDRPTPVDVSLVLPAGLEAHPARKKATLPPGQTVSIDFQLRISEQQEGTRRVVLADMWFDGRYLGQITELVVDSLLPVPDETLK